MRILKKNKMLLASCLIVTMFIVTGCIGQKEEETVKEVSTVSFEEVTGCQNFHDVPVLKAAHSRIGEAVDYGDGVYVIAVEGTEQSDYQTYLDTLKEAGFTLYADNGEKGLAETIYTATFTKENQVVTVSHAVRVNKTYISAGGNRIPSGHLIYQDDYIKDNKEEAKTTLHMVEQYESGNSFIIQMKDGRFIVIDGAEANDAPYLLKYLESLVPEGKKPIIDAWIISHAHRDHYGAFYEIAREEAYSKRLTVNGVYYSATSDAAANLSDGNTEGRDKILMYSINFRTETGERTQVYRPQLGQRYYFNDVTMDIVFTQEQLFLDPDYVWFNDTSTWCMFTIEGQKFLHAADADHWSQDAVMEIYDSEYFTVDVMAAFHHGLNIFDRFTDFCTKSTVLYPCYRVGSYHVNDMWTRQSENDHLVASAKEAIAWGNGTKVLTFPYTVGSYKTLPLWTWSERGKLLIEK